MKKKTLNTAFVYQSAKSASLVNKILSDKRYNVLNFMVSPIAAEEFFTL